MSNILTSAQKDEYIELLNVDSIEEVFPDFPENVKDDDDVVHEAVLKSVDVFCFASNRLRKDKKFIQEIITSGEYAGLLFYADRSVFGDAEFMMSLIYSGVEAVQYISNELRANKEFVLEVINSSDAGTDVMNNTLKSIKELPNNPLMDDLDVIGAFYKKSTVFYMRKTYLENGIPESAAHEFEHNLKQSSDKQIEFHKEEANQIISDASASYVKNINNPPQEEMAMALIHNLGFLALNDIIQIQESIKKRTSIHSSILEIVKNDVSRRKILAIEKASTMKDSSKQSKIKNRRFLNG